MQSRTFKQEKAKDEAFQPAAGKPINRVSGAFSVDDQSRTIHDAPVSQAHLQGHIDLIAKHEQEF